MPWGRLDDGLYDHPKLDELGRDRLPAVGLWALAISWSNRRLTDGFLPAERIRLLGGTLALAKRLVDVGLFDLDGNDYRVHDFLEFNDSRESVETRRAQDAARKRDVRHGVRSGVRSDTGSESTMESEPDSGRSPAVTRARPHDRARPDPTRPDPEEKTENKRVPSSLSTRATNGAGPYVDDESTTLSKRELETWSTFGPEWSAFREAWIGRGLRMAPTGEADVEGSQRSVLWQVLDARPNDLVRWVREAPRSAKTSHDVVAHVLSRWREARAEAEAML